MTDTVPIAALAPEELARLHALWQSFRERWPIEKLRAMTLEQYTDLQRKDAFIYWVELVLDDIGSIRGSNAFKFGVYRRRSSAAKTTSGPYAYSDKYAWWSYLGKTEADAFHATRAKVIAVAEHAAAGRFDAIENVELSLLYKWKLAFLYQPVKSGIVLPIFAEKPIRTIYANHVGGPWVPRNKCYRALREKYGQVADIVDLGFRLWAEYEDVAETVTLEEGDEALAALSMVSTGATPPRARNLILYGPPGTGKTHATEARAVALAETRVGFALEAREEFQRLRRTGRVSMVTFHQSYGYEDFVEGLRPMLGASSAEVRYEMRAGAFKDIAFKAAAAGLKRTTEPAFDLLWDELVKRVDAAKGFELKSTSGIPYLLEVISGGKGVRSTRLGEGKGEPQEPGRMSVPLELARLWWDHRGELGAPAAITQPKSTELIRRAWGTGGGHHFTPTWMVHKELVALREEVLQRATKEEPTAAQVQAALDDPSGSPFDFSHAPQFVLVIDEINRGNISKILGELITLLEPDRRLTAPGEMRIRLAGSSDHWFAVPPNLHIVGTMNTADRSIALMDVALRRRFELEEVMPNPDVVRSVLAAKGRPAPIAALTADLLSSLNERIEILFDRDHVLGHAYFLDIENLESLRRTFADRILPLLSEYFYGRWDRIATVLGCPYDEDGKPLRKGVSNSAPMIIADSNRAAAVLGYEASEFEARPRFVGNEKLLRPGATNDELAHLFVGALALNPQDHEKRVAEVLG